MREEKYRIKCPKHVLFGDPSYFEEYENDIERLRKLVVDYRPDPSFAAGMILREEPHPEEKSYILLSVNLYFAPEQRLETYMKDLMFKGQDMEEKGIGVDTAQYLIEVDGRYEEINTGGDGWWGRNLEFTHRIGAKKALDASVVTIWMPEDETFEGMKKLAGYLFEDLRPLEKTTRKKRAEER